jgi:hypothetical protein
MKHSQHEEGHETRSDAPTRMSLESVGGQEDDQINDGTTIHNSKAVEL